jgi:diaminohydroxyphosphoribosylaminopyrimidine deaminase / 5-amino-6-(5-phosphoribosylamino)uracil reductase
MAKRPAVPDDDVTSMKRAIELAWSVKGATIPNPAVGAVIVADGRVVGEGATRECGGPHAERVALVNAGSRARGATLYVTLEPCCHFGRTPPCTDAVIAAGISRVVAAVGDPNPLVNGKGRRQLRRAGIAVETGLLRDEAAAVNEDFFWAITKRRAWITLKLAFTLDGRIADPQGGSKWITNEPARRFVHELRRRHAAIAVGRATLESDDPQLTVRYGPSRAPARCVFSSGSGIPRDSYFARNAHEARSIVVTADGGRRRIEHDGATGIEFWHTGTRNPLVNARRFTEMACENDLISVMVEGGQKLASAFLEAGLVNRVYLFYGNKLLCGGKEGLLFSKGLTIDRAISLKQFDLLSFGESFAVTGIPDNIVED